MLKRLTASLLPLAAHPSIAGAAARAASDTEARSGLVGAAGAGDAEFSAQPKPCAHPSGPAFKHLQLLAVSPGESPSASPSASLSAAEYACLYHKLRLARASGTRIRSIADPAGQRNGKLRNT